MLCDYQHTFVPGLFTAYSFAYLLLVISTTIHRISTGPFAVDTIYIRITKTADSERGGSGSSREVAAWPLGQALSFPLLIICYLLFFTLVFNHE